MFYFVRNVKIFILLKKPENIHNLDFYFLKMIQNNESIIKIVDSFKSSVTETKHKSLHFNIV